MPKLLGKDEYLCCNTSFYLRRPGFYTTENMSIYAANKFEKNEYFSSMSFLNFFIVYYITL